MVETLDFEWDNREWREDFCEALGPEYWMWYDQSLKEEAIKELTSGGHTK